MIKITEWQTKHTHTVASGGRDGIVARRAGWRLPLAKIPSDLTTSKNKSRTKGDRDAARDRKDAVSVAAP